MNVPPKTLQNKCRFFCWRRQQSGRIQHNRSAVTMVSVLWNLRVPPYFSFLCNGLSSTISLATGSVLALLLLPEHCDIERDNNRGLVFFHLKHFSPQKSRFETKMIFVSSSLAFTVSFSFSLTDIARCQALFQSTQDPCERYSFILDSWLVPFPAPNDQA